MLLGAGGNQVPRDGEETVRRADSGMRHCPPTCSGPEKSFFCLGAHALIRHAAEQPFASAECYGDPGITQGKAVLTSRLN